MEFKNKKEMSLKQQRDLNEELRVKSDNLELKNKKFEKLAENQYNFELKSAVGMIYDKTKKKLTHDVTFKFALLSLQTTAIRKKNIFLIYMWLQLL